MKLIIDDKDIKELPLPTLDTEGRVILPPRLGRIPGKPEIDSLTKKIIAVEANRGVSQNFLAKAHNISQPEVSIIERGIDRTNIDGRKVNEELFEVGQSVKEKIIDKATSKLLASLDQFEPDALEQKELPGAAMKLASVVEKVTGQNKESGNNVVFNVYAPRLMREEQFQTIELNER